MGPIFDPLQIFRTKCSIKNKLIFRKSIISNHEKVFVSEKKNPMFPLKRSKQLEKTVKKNERIGNRDKAF